MATIRGGQKLEAQLASIAVGLRSGGTLRVGFLEGATYPAKPRAQVRRAYAKRKARGILAPLKGDVGTINVPTVAFFNEYGTGTAPPRPFFRRMIRLKSGEWGPALAALLRQNGYALGKCLRILGEGIAGQLRQSIIDTNAPPLAQSTIARKGFAKPLVDTGHMLASVDYEVRT